MKNMKTLVTCCAIGSALWWLFCGGLMAIMLLPLLWYWHTRKRLGDHVRERGDIGLQQNDQPQD